MSMLFSSEIATSVPSSSSRMGLSPIVNTVPGATRTVPFSESDSVTTPATMSKPFTLERTREGALNEHSSTRLNAQRSRQRTLNEKHTTIPNRRSGRHGTLNMLFIGYFHVLVEMPTLPSDVSPPTGLRSSIWRSVNSGWVIAHSSCCPQKS